MKILFLASEVGKGKGGIQKFNEELLTALKKLRHDVRLISFSRFEGRAKKIKFVKEVIKTLMSEDFDLVFYGHINFYLLPFLLSFSLARPYLVITHGEEVWNLNNFLKKKFLRESKITVTVSSFTKQKLKEQLPSLSVFILPNTIRGEKFKPAPPSEKLMEKYELKGKKILLTVARFSSSQQYKGYDKVIQALPKVIEEIPNLKYLLVGKGDDAPRVKRLVQKLDLENYVEFCGFIPEEKLVDYYNVCDLFVMPSKGEGFGIVFLEALACNRPVIAGNKDGSRDAVLNGEVGKLVDPDNIDEIAGAITESLTGKAPEKLLEEKHLRKKVIEAYGPDNFRKRLNQLLEELM